MGQRGFGFLPILIVISLLFAGGLYYYSENKEKSTERLVDQSSNVEPANLSEWKTYTNPARKFSFKYPSELEIAINREEKLDMVTPHKSVCRDFGLEIRSEKTFLIQQNEKYKSIEIGGKNAERADWEVTTDGITCINTDIVFPSTENPAEAMDYSIRVLRRKDKHEDLIDKILLTFKFTK